MPSVALERHPAAACAALRGIEATVTRLPAASLRVVYRLEGEIERLRLPPPRPPRRAERLWEHTCCEIFISPALPAYREFNFSPSSEWAAYGFARYREGRPMEMADPGITVRRGEGQIELSATVAFPEARARIGLSAVIEDEAGVLSYWALRHPAGKPDFHHADGFALELDEARA
jgi:hypothetical protein